MYCMKYRLHIISSIFVMLSALQGWWNLKLKKKNQIKIKLKLTNVQPANRKCNVSCWDLSFLGLGYVNYIETINWNSQ